ncbi:MAG: deoxyribonuclease V [Candidatus Latescibacterota bacterium]
MIEPDNMHPWNLTCHEALDLQLRLRQKLRVTPLPLRKIQYVAGADVAVSNKLGVLVSAVVVLRFPSLDIVECQTAHSTLSFPYIPGLLSFREIPGLIHCFEKVRTPFQLLLCDGQGIAHPRRFGLACHLGVVLKMPTIGCAKSLLVGEHEPVGERKGDEAPLMYEGKRVGTVLRTRSNVKPLFVSPGNLVDQVSARRIVMSCVTKYRLPEPTRRAHILAGEHKQRLEMR